MWLIGVQDNGIGIETEAFERIFQPDAAAAWPEIAGSGIGLATCKKIVTRAGGRIWVESQVGSGSTFSLRFLDLRRRNWLRRRALPQRMGFDVRVADQHPQFPPYLLNDGPPVSGPLLSKRRIVGYHGESWRFIIHRQSHR